MKFIVDAQLPPAILACQAHPVSDVMVGFDQRWVK